MTLNDCLIAVISESRQPYAIGYAKAMTEARVRYGDAGERSQILYILNNLSGWRGERARAVKAALKEFSKGGI